MASQNLIVASASMIRVHEGNYVVRALQYQQRVKFHETTQLLFF